MNILIIEDEKTLCELLELVLIEQGHTVSLVYDGDDAMNLILANDYDVIVADMTLPGICGMNIIQWAQKRNPEKHYILMSGYEINENQKDLIKNVSCHFISKPFHLKEMSRLINSLGS